MLRRGGGAARNDGAARLCSAAPAVRPRRCAVRRCSTEVMRRRCGGDAGILRQCGAALSAAAIPQRCGDANTGRISEGLRRTVAYTTTFQVLLCPCLHPHPTSNSERPCILTSSLQMTQHLSPYFASIFRYIRSINPFHNFHSSSLQTHFIIRSANNTNNKKYLTQTQTKLPTIMHNFLSL